MKVKVIQNPPKNPNPNYRPPLPTPCQYCRGVFWTSTPFSVRTQLGNDLEAVFNFCPVCGRKLLPEKIKKSTFVLK